MRQSIVLFVMMIMISSLGAGCIGERVLDRFTDDSKEKKECKCDEEKIEALNIEIRALEEELSADPENEDLQAKLDLLKEEVEVLLKKCDYNDRRDRDIREDREEQRSESEEKCYDENRQEIECEDGSDTEENTNDEDSDRTREDTSDDTNSDEERCYDENRQEIECEDSSA